jgi:predicted nuclease of predicted toxin-antitoxin system
MKILIDENLPKRLKDDFFEFEIYTTFDKKWNCKKMDNY